METNGYIKSGGEQTAHRRLRKTAKRDLLWIHRLTRMSWSRLVTKLRFTFCPSKLPASTWCPGRRGSSRYGYGPPLLRGVEGSANELQIHVLPVQVRPADPIISVSAQ